MLRFAPLLLAAAALGVSGPAPARDIPADTPAAAPLDRAALIAQIRELVRDRYVLPDTAVALDRALAEADARGAFAGLEGKALAEAITAAMRTVTPDGHLMALYDPRQAADLVANPPVEDEEEEDVASPEQAHLIALNNGGVRKLEVLPGNVRYMDYTGFMWGAPADQQAVVQAMEFLRGGSAVVIDLRRNGGGSPDAVARLASYFLPARTPLMRFEMRGRKPSATSSPAAPFTLADRPVFVLTSKRSFSAAEEFAAHVDAFGFGRLVGETTGGGGFRNEFFPLPGGLVVSISTGQAVQAKTGKGWERTGIAPAIAVPADRALDAAHAQALAELAATAPEGERQALETMLPFYRAKADRPAAARPLADYVGTYGPLAVTLGGDGQLWSQFFGDTSPLVGLGEDVFAPDSRPRVRVRFEAEGDAVVAAEVDTPSGPQRFPRG